MELNNILLRNATVVNEGIIFASDILIKNGRIEKIKPSISTPEKYREINAEGLHLFPGIIDDQVHFREPGLTHKADIYTESRAGVAGGVTSYMEMPNTNPQTLTQHLLQQKYDLAAQKSISNYSFYMGAGNSNLDEVLKTNPKNVCGIKIFMGSSTGDMLVDDESTLNGIFSETPILIATHCEDENTIQSNLAKYTEQYGENIPVQMHPYIRSREACYLSSSRAVSLAKKYQSRLHILHISTEEEIALFDSQIPLEKKKITAEACIHHLWFSEEDYIKKGNLIKWNPAVKSASDRDALIRALKENKIDVIATDHAPHTIEEKKRPYKKAPSGGPLIQHSLQAMLELVSKGIFTLPEVVNKMAHSPAILFSILDRGFIREGYKADMVLVNLKNSTQVKEENTFYKCGWSPFDGYTFSSSIHSTFVNGRLVFHAGKFIDDFAGERLIFNR